MSAGTAVDEQSSSSNEEPSTGGETNVEKVKRGSRQIFESVGSRCTKWTVLLIVLTVMLSSGIGVFLYVSWHEKETFHAKVSPLLHEWRRHL